MNWIQILAAIFLIVVVLVAAGLWFLISRLSPGYEVVGDKVNFRIFNNVTWKIERKEVDGADAYSWKSIRQSGGLYGKDKDNVYFQQTRLTDANPATFRVLDWREEFSCDADRVYWKSIAFSDDPGKFQVLGRGYSKDAQNVYYGSRVVEDADPDSFEVTGTVTSEAKDKNHQYEMGRKK